MSTLRTPGVVSVNEIGVGQTGGIDQYGNRRYRRAWLVTTDNTSVGPLQATAGGILPPLFSRYEGYDHTTVPATLIEWDDGATLREYSWEKTDNLYTSIVYADYSSAPTQTQYDYNPFDFGTIGGGFDTGDPKEQNPIGRAVQVQWGTLRYQKALNKSLDIVDGKAKAITASNGQRFDPPLLVDRSYITLTITRNETAYNPLTAVNYVDRVNGPQSWQLGGAINFTFGPGLAKCEAITAQSMVEQGYFFWRVSYAFLINPNKKEDNTTFEGWQPELMDVGTYQWKLISGPALIRQAIIDKQTAMPVTSPVPLDLNGRELQPTQQSFPVKFDYKYITFKCYHEANFNALGLP